MSSSVVTTKINKVIEKFENQYFYAERVGTYLLNLDNQTILFDLPTYSIEVKKYLLSKKKPMIAFLSHGSCGIADGRKWQEEVGLEVCLHKKDKGSVWLDMQPDVLFTKPPELPANLELIHTPGHSPGSICILEKSTKTLLTGDTVEGTKGGKIYDFTGQSREDTEERLKSCRKLLGYDFKHILPFHYEPIFNVAKEALQEFVDEKIG